MTREQQLDWERRWARPTAICAFISAALSLTASLIGQAANKTTVNDNVDRLVQIHKHSGAFVAASVAGAIATILLAPVLYYLFRATRFRRPQLPAALVYALAAAPVLLAVFGIAAALKEKSIATQFANLPAAPPYIATKAADHALKDGTLNAFGGLQLAGGLGLIASFIIVSLNAMRAGLLSRFMGTLGIIVGVLLVLPLPLPFVQVFWVAAMGVLYLGLWPQGRGPAWDSGEAIPWPTAADKRGALEGRGRETGGRASPATASNGGEVRDHDDEAVATTIVERPRTADHSRSKKRKRKRRG